MTLLYERRKAYNSRYLHMNRLEIFLSYSHRDRAYLRKDSLIGALRALMEEERVDLWSDERIAAGALWDDEIRSRLLTSDIGIMLVSQRFLDSPYCTNVEVATFLKRRSEDGMRLFLIILSPCEWELHEWLAG